MFAEKKFKKIPRNPFPWTHVVRKSYPHFYRCTWNVLPARTFLGAAQGRNGFKTRTQGFSGLWRSHSAAEQRDGVLSWVTGWGACQWGFEDSSHFPEMTIQYIHVIFHSSDGKKSTCTAGDPWVGKIPWEREWQPTPVFLPGEFPGQRSLVGYSPRGRRVGHNWSTNAFTLFHFLPSSFACSSSSCSLGKESMRPCKDESSLYDIFNMYITLSPVEKKPIFLSRL